VRDLVPLTPPPPPPPSPPAPRRIAAAWFLGVFGTALLILLWLRGAGRLLLPVLLIALLAWGVTSFLRKVREPVD
jgi:hypothetical protein